jgi:glycosyltransferase involved in cell wall biosynthesis
MRIVIGCNSGNEYIGQLNQSLSTHEKVEEATESLYQFWQRPEDVDVLHIQWPEALFDWEEPTPWGLAYLADVLDEWSKTARVVTTVHNYKPHDNDYQNHRKLYRLVYRASDGIVHLGEASRKWFLDRYDFAAKKHHAVIPHGNYTCFQDEVDSAEARDRLSLGSDDFVCLCFGNIRHPEEVYLLLDSFDQFSVRRKRLVIAGRLPPISSLTIRYWRLRYDPRFRIREGYIPDEEVQVYLRAADAVVVPREGVLNSGNVALGFTFGRPVVGPDEGVIGEILSETGNPAYKPGDARSLARKLEWLAETNVNIGNKNEKYALERMGWGNVSSKHIEFYKNRLQK